MLGLIEEILRVVPEFQNYNSSQIVVSGSQSVSRRSGGLLAYLMPLKYKDGRPFEKQIRGKWVYHYGMVPIILDGVEMLYIIYFLLPRFFNLNFRDKLETVIHELYHINPQFNGDVRRFPGRSYLHGSSMKEYDRKVRELTDSFLESPHDEMCYAFLKRNHSELRRTYGPIHADRVMEPKPTLIKTARNHPVGIESGQMQLL